MNATPRPRIAVILPAYNEEITIAETIGGFAGALPGAAIYVIDNNSKDATHRIAKETLADCGNPGAVIFEPRQGKGNALRRAFMEVDADAYLLSDADLTYPCDQASELLGPILEGRADMVVGDRHSGGHYARENKRSWHGFGNRLVQSLVNGLFGAHLTDIMSGYRAFNRRFVKNYPILVDGFEVETDMTLHALYRRFRILEIPVAYRDRPQGSHSKLNTLADGAKVVFAITQILRFYKPLAFFSGIAGLFTVLGILAGIPVLHDWFTMRYIAHLPLAVLASALEVVAILMFGVGLMLDSVAYHERLEYERHLVNQSSRP